MKLPQKVNVLLLGSGGREHALAWKIAQSDRVSKLYTAPGNAGTAQCGMNVDIAPTNFASLKQFVLSSNINLVVVGPEEPLVAGIHDFFAGDNEIRYTPVVGPSADGAKLEGSKQFAKEFMTRHGIPTAKYKSFSKDNLTEAPDFLKTLTPPYVLKANGLAAGKGVLIIDDFDQAVTELNSMIEGRFGAAGSKVVIEEYLSGIELSVFVATDGIDYKILPEAKDYKRVGDGDKGLNTGGMGAVSPVPFADEAFMSKVEERIIKPTIEGLKKEKITYNGFIFIGLMNVNGDPYVIEYNVRMGDPETEVVIPRIESDIIELFEGIVYETLSEKELSTSPKTAVTVMTTSKGYPGDYEKGKVIEGLDNVGGKSMLFHAGTASDGGRVVTSGGRVISVTSLGDSIKQAATKSYGTIKKFSFEGMNYRKDIGKDLMKLTGEAEPKKPAAPKKASKSDDADKESAPRKTTSSRSRKKKTAEE
ncbi:MAG: phosphoribosylamine--glycine ligase [Rikenellaceae bacterium]|nr:phosphoribosylamine--glycine ligase [Rikenellaceae bacterium]